MSAITRKIPGLEDAAQFAAAYRVIWRWHFYAGLFCLPFIVVLCLSGTVFLFKPQINAFLDRPYDHLALLGEAKSLDEQVAAGQAAMPNARLTGVELRDDPTDAARVHLMTGKPGEGAFENYRVLVRPDTLEILKKEAEKWTPAEIAGNIHGTLLLGTPGHIALELVGAWAIVMMVTGLYLWWPRDGRGVAGVLYPRLSASGRLFWRDLHAVTGVWLSFLAMFFLLSALPWTTVWGGGFKYLRSVGKQQLVKQDWPTGPADKEQKAKEGFENTPAAPAEDPHARHRGQAGAALAPARDAISGFDRIAPIAARLGLAAPVSIAPPSPEMPNWTVLSISQNRMLQKTVMFDAKTLEKVTESGFADRPFIDRVFGIAISAHEGQLFGWFNQLLGLLTAAGYLVLVVSSAVMWWRRRPRGALGAPPAFAPEPRLALSIVVMIAFLGVFLPTLGVSLVLVLTAEQIIRRFAPRTSRWLGLRPAG